MGGWFQRGGVSGTCPPTHRHFQALFPGGSMAQGVFAFLPGVPAALHTCVQAAAGQADRTEERCHLRLLGPQGA